MRHRSEHRNGLGAAALAAACTISTLTAPATAHASGDFDALCSTATDQIERHRRGEDIDIDALDQTTEALAAHEAELGASPECRAALERGRLMVARAYLDSEVSGAESRALELIDRVIHDAVAHVVDVADYGTRLAREYSRRERALAEPGLVWLGVECEDACELYIGAEPVPDGSAVLEHGEYHVRIIGSSQTNAGEVILDDRVTLDGTEPNIVLPRALAPTGEEPGPVCPDAEVTAAPSDAQSCEPEEIVIREPCKTCPVPDIRHTRARRAGGVLLGLGFVTGIAASGSIGVLSVTNYLRNQDLGDSGLVTVHNTTVPISIATMNATGVLIPLAIGLLIKGDRGMRRYAQHFAGTGYRF